MLHAILLLLRVFCKATGTRVYSILVMLKLKVSSFHVVAQERVQ